MEEGANLFAMLVHKWVCDTVHWNPNRQHTSSLLHKVDKTSSSLRDCYESGSGLCNLQSLYLGPGREGSGEMAVSFQAKYCRCTRESRIASVKMDQVPLGSDQPW